MSFVLTNDVNKKKTYKRVIQEPVSRCVLGIFSGYLVFRFPYFSLSEAICCFPGRQLESVSTQATQPALWLAGTHRAACGQCCSEGDNMLHGEFVRADIKHVWSSGSRKIREVDLWLKATSLNFQVDGEKCGRTDQTMSTLTSLKYHRLGFSEGTLSAAAAVELLWDQKCKTQCESVQQEREVIKCGYVQANFPGWIK